MRNIPIQTKSSTVILSNVTNVNKNTKSHEYSHCPKNNPQNDNQTKQASGNITQLHCKMEWQETFKREKHHQVLGNERRNGLSRIEQRYHSEVNDTQSQFWVTW